MIKTNTVFARLGLFVLSTLALVVLPGQASAAESLLRVEKLNAQNWDSLYPGGPDAISGYGDWALSNGTLCAAVSDLEHETGVTPFGGVLVDLGHCGAANDQWLMTHLLPNMSTGGLTRPDSINIGREDGDVSITVVGMQQGLRLETRYLLSDEQRDSLLLEHTLTRVADGDALNTVGAMVLHPGRAITPYSLSTATREYSLGFDWLAVDRSDEATMLAAMQPGNLQVLMGADGLGAPITYGLALESVRKTDADGDSSELSNFLITASDYTLFGVLT